MSTLVEKVWTTRNPFAGLLIVLLAILLGIGITAYGYLALAGLAGAIAFVIFAFHPIWGLFLTTALLLLSGGQGMLSAGGMDITVPVTVSKLCGVATLGAWVANLIARQKPWKVTWEAVLVLAFFAWSLLGVMYSADAKEEFAEWIAIGNLVFFSIMTIDILANSGDVRKNVHAYVLLLVFCGFLSSLSAVSQYVFSKAAVLTIGEQLSIEKYGGAVLDTESLQGGGAVRVAGRALHSNWLALLILCSLPLTAYVYSAMKSTISRVVVILGALTYMAALVLTFTRAGLVVGVAILGVAFAKHLLRFNPNRLIALLVVMVLAWMVLPDEYKERVLSPKQYTSSTSVQVRADLQRHGWQFFTEHPIKGVGLAGFGFNLVQQGSETGQEMKLLGEAFNWSPRFMGVHNLYLQVACETGLVGLILFLALVAMVLRKLWRAERVFEGLHDRQGIILVTSLQISIIAFLLSGVFLHALQQKIWWMVMPTAVAVSLYAQSLAQGISKNADGAGVSGAA